MHRTPVSLSAIGLVLAFPMLVHLVGCVWHWEEWEDESLCDDVEIVRCTATCNGWAWFNSGDVVIEVNTVNCATDVSVEIPGGSDPHQLEEQGVGNWSTKIYPPGIFDCEGFEDVRYWFHAIGENGSEDEASDECLMLIGDD